MKVVYLGAQDHVFLRVCVIMLQHVKIFVKKKEEYNLIRGRD